MFGVQSQGELDVLSLVLHCCFSNVGIDPHCQLVEHFRNTLVIFGADFIVFHPESLSQSLSTFSRDFPRLILAAVLAAAILNIDLIGHKHLPNCLGSTQVHLFHPMLYITL